MPKSIVNPQSEFDEELYLVSLLNYKGKPPFSSYFPSLSNHSMIIVEGLVLAEEKKMESKTFFQPYQSVDEKIKNKTLFQRPQSVDKSVIGRYELTGLASPEEHSRVVILNEGMPRPERVPQDAIVLHKEAYQVTAYWRQGSEIISKMCDLREKGQDGELILGPFEDSQHRTTPYVISKEINNEFIEKVISVYGCPPPHDKKRESGFINKKMWITDIGYKEGSPEDKEFKDKAFHEYHSRSFLVKPNLVIDMLESIEGDREICERAALGECDYLLYQFVGKNHFFSDPGEGDNCAGWCVDKLIVAGLKEDVAGLKTKPKVLVGQSCTIL